jgi:hypothetical protein
MSSVAQSATQSATQVAPQASAQPTALPPRGEETRDQVARQVSGVDAIEVKATIPDKQIDGALRHFKMTIDNDEERYVYFFDTEKHDLLNAGIIARARRVVGDQHDSTVKFRPVVPSEISKEWTKFKGFKLEADASEKGVVRSASLTMPVEKGLIKKVAASKKPIKSLFSKEQEDFLKAMGGQQIDFETLTILGPLQANRWQLHDPSCPWPITVEVWHRADGARLMEASVKAPVAQSAVAIAGFMGLLAELGAERDADQQTKTRWAFGA